VRRAFAALGFVVVLASGCGEESKPPDEEERLSRADYIRRADEICAEYDRRLDALAEPKTVRDVGRLAEEAFPIAQDGISKLRELRPPKELSRQVTAWLRLNDANVRHIHRLEEAAEDGDTRRVQQIASEAADNEERADALAKEIGLVECARTGTARSRR
jgi:hypothetical protein